MSLLSFGDLYHLGPHFPAKEEPYAQNMAYINDPSLKISFSFLSSPLALLVNFLSLPFWRVGCVVGENTDTVMAHSLPS